jgi:hypothetical protein
MGAVLGVLLVRLKHRAKRVKTFKQRALWRNLMADESWKSGYLTMIDDCKKRESQLSAEERSFIDSISRQLELNCDLSFRQVEKLESIWDKVTSVPHYRG